MIKFEGCYHGHADSFLIRAGSGALTFGTPSSPGVPSALAALTLLARFNDAEGVARFVILDGEFRAQVGNELTEIIRPTADGITILDVNP